MDAQRSIHISRRAQDSRNPVDREVGHYAVARPTSLWHQYGPRLRVIPTAVRVLARHRILREQFDNHVVGSPRNEFALNRT